MKHFARLLFAGWLLLGLPAPASAFDLAALQAQLTAPALLEGRFTQEKHLRSLPAPLVSTGRFALAAGQGLTWELQAPLAQTLRITPEGITRVAADGQEQRLSDSRSPEARLFLSLLSGDTQGLTGNFDPELQGQADDWRLTLRPKSDVLSQIFTRIEIQGGAAIRRIALYETQGDYTLLTLEPAP